MASIEREEIPKRRPGRKLAGAMALGALMGSGVGGTLKLERQDMDAQTAAYATQHNRSRPQEVPNDWLKYLLFFGGLGTAIGTLTGHVLIRDEFKRKRIDDALAKRGPTRARVILHALKDPEWDFQQYAMDALAKRPDERDVDLLARIVQTQHHASIQRKAFHALRDLAGRGSSQPFINSLRLVFPHVQTNARGEITEDLPVMRNVVATLSHTATRVRSTPQAILFLRQTRALHQHAK